MRHVGDRDDQSESAALALAIDRVVEVLGGLAVDGDQRQFGDVLAPGPVLLAHLVGQLARECAGSRGEVEGQLVLAQRDLDLHARVGVVPQHFGDPPDRLGEFRRLLDQFHCDDLSFARALSRRGDEDILRNAPILGDHEQDAVLFEDTPHHALIGAIEDLDHLAFGTTATIRADDPRNDSVTMQDLAHLLGSEKYVGLLVVAYQEAEAVGMAGHASADQIRLVGQNQGAAAISDHLPVALHRTQATLEQPDFICRDIEGLAKLFESQGYALVGENLLDVLATGQRIRVLRDLALEIGVRLANLAETGLACGLAARIASVLLGH